MKWRRLILIGALVLVAALLVAAWPRGPKEPVYEGRKLSIWMREAYTDAISGTKKYTPAQRDAAREAIKAIGSNAVPYLLSEFEQPPSRWTLLYNRWVIKLNLPKLKAQPARGPNGLAINALRLLEPEAAPAVPTLVRYLPDKERGRFAASALSKCTALAVPQVLEYFSGTNWRSRLLALDLLVMAVGDDDENLKPIMALLNHTNQSVRIDAAVSLRLSTRSSSVSVRALAKALSHPDPNLQASAAVSLMYLGTNANPAVPDLQRLLKSADTNVAHWASNALFNIDPAALPGRGPGQ